MVGYKSAKGIVRQAGNPGGFATQTSHTHSRIKLGTTNFKIKTAGLFKSVKRRRGKTDHRFAKADQIIGHETTP
jgi:hypothetical protein